MKRKRGAVRALIIIGAVLLFAVLFVLINNYSLTVTYAEYKTYKIKEAVRIVMVSDLHGKYFGKDNAALSDKILNEEPDIVVLAGDMVGNNGDTSAVTALIKKLSAKCENICFAFGNHEKREEVSGGAERITEEIQAAGAKVLNNGVLDLRDVTISGLDLPLYFYSGYDENGELIYELDSDKINEYLGESGAGLNVLIAHNPIYFEAYANWGADIVLSGHNHGGVIRLPFIGGIASPNGDRKNRRYDCGEYTIGESSVSLSRGLGEWVGPVRCFNLPEIYVIDALPYG